MTGKKFIRAAAAFILLVTGHPLLAADGPPPAKVKVAPVAQEDDAERAVRAALESLGEPYASEMARSVQEITEEIVLRMAKNVRCQTGMKDLVMSGGVALNCVANGRLLREGPFEEIWIQPAAGDAGGNRPFSCRA